MGDVLFGLLIGSMVGFMLAILIVVPVRDNLGYEHVCSSHGEKYLLWDNGKVVCEGDGGVTRR